MRRRGAELGGEGNLQVFLSEELGWRHGSRSESLWRAPRTHAHYSRTHALAHSPACDYILRRECRGLVVQGGDDVA